MAFSPKISERGKYKFAEMVTAAGPQTLGVTGDNSYDTLFGREWLLVLDRSTLMLHLYQEDSASEGSWTEVVAGLPVSLFGSPMPTDARRITFAFDQSARIITAYESEGIVKVTRWDTTLVDYVQNVSFAACDPTLLMDATITKDIPRSDVVLFYLDSDRTRVCYRVQNENYAIEHELIATDSPVILDRANTIYYRYQLLLSNATGNVLPEVLQSALYPINVFNDLGSSFNGPIDGVLDLVVLVYQAGEDDVQPTFTGPVDGDFREPIIGYEASEVAEIQSAFGGPIDGSWVSVVITEEVGDVGIESAFGGPIDGNIALVVITHVVEDPTELSATFSGPVGGTYASA